MEMERIRLQIRGQILIRLIRFIMIMVMVMKIKKTQRRPIRRKSNLMQFKILSKMPLL